MEVSKKLGEILLSGREKLILLWEADAGFCVAADGCDTLQKEALKENGIAGVLSLVSDQDRELCTRFLEKLQRGCAGAQMPVAIKESRMEIYLHLKMTDGQYRYVKLTCYLHKDRNGMTDKYAAMFREISAEENYRLELAEHITNDKNPAYFAAGAKSLMDKHQDWNFALVQFDVAKFKIINEQYGESVGDEILRFFVHTLSQICDENQLYARLTADVFMILTPYMVEEDIYALIMELDRKLLGYRDIPYTLFYGVCYVRDKNENLRKYGDGAAFARQYVKGDALHHIGFYRDDMKEKAKLRKFVEDHMVSALEKREFVMYLQPKYSISQNKMIGAEALARWIDPERGMISPADFIPVFEENGFVVRLDYYIWEEACKLIRSRMNRGLSLFPISVNVSRRHLNDDKFIHVLNGLIEKYKMDRTYLELEITETIDSINTYQGISLLKENGYVLLMDDFGSGYSSLNTLKNTRFDMIKIDRGFLQDSINSDRGKKIVAHTIRMTKDIGLDMIAEGVETKEQADFLKECGCDKAQGFYYAKPMCMEEFNRMFSERRSHL